MNHSQIQTHPLAGLESLLPRCLLRDRIRLGQRLRKGRRLSSKEAERLLRQAQTSARLREERERGLPAPTYPEDLPITARREEILRAIRENPAVIVAGETGSGKTTQLPKICLEAGRGREATIALTQPRRVAALSISRRIAQELNLTWGREVGCKIRFTDRTAPQTCIKVVTDGMLLAETQKDPELWEYDTIIVDEAHERSLNIDFLLGYLRLLRQRRPELKILLTSATIDTQAFSRAFDQAPVIEVSGRVYPVEVRYWPLDQGLEDSGEYTYIDAAVGAVDQLIEESPWGDILVFMPSERDIRETRDRLAGRGYRRAEILPLFGRLTAAEQQKVFAPQEKRRIVVATNIAETSLTIPRIRYVVDTGLARLSRYNPRTHTRRLPIEPVAQSSAQQRQGRCGRVEQGVCVRLYSERDFLSRPRYTQPEIQRANLAEVILRMMAMNLGQVETFPFIDPPRPQAIAGGYQLLRELGALDDERRLTPLGRDLARLPIDPTVGRMILQAQEENALSEVLVIAAAISVQDPRERPADQQQMADQVHRQFQDKNSDFLTFLKIWNAYHDQLESASQNQLRKFCKSHFLSYVRLREWRDIHAQLMETLGELGGFRFNEEPAAYEAIHRAILTGLLSNAARRKEGNVYQVARQRQAMIFPGSGLFHKNGRNDQPSGEKQDKAPEWIVAAEIVETSRLFARTVARIDPSWLAELGSHLCRVSCDQPYWNARSGRVLVRQKFMLHGLQVLERRVAYGPINPREATEIFIREALVPGQVHSPHAFLEHNRRLCDKLETWQTRARGLAGIDVQEAACRFYAARLEDVSSLHDLNRLVRARGAESLFMKEEDLLGQAATGFDARTFPDAVEMDGEQLALSYAYRPGEEEDGVTLRVPYKLVHAIDQEVLEWLVPGLLEEKITHLLRGLPKAIRKELVPIPEKARQIAVSLRPTHPTFLESLQAHIREQYRLSIQSADWNAELPEHLRMRVQVQGADQQPLIAGRDLEALKGRLESHDTPAELNAWNKAAREWERKNARQWEFGDLPEWVEITQVGGVPLCGFPGLEPDEEGVAVRLYRSRDQAEEKSRRGLLRLCQLQLKDELATVQRELKDLDRLKKLYGYLDRGQPLREQALAHLERHVFQRERILPLGRRDFEEELERARKRLRGLALRFLSLVEELFKTRRQLLLSGQEYADLEADLERLLPADFLEKTPYEQLPHLGRYLQAVHRRAERARLDPPKDAHKAARMAPYQEKLDRFLAAETLSPAQQVLVQELRWMVEEYRVSVFAQELGTAQPVSPKRLEAKIAQIEQAR